MESSEEYYHLRLVNIRAKWKEYNNTFENVLKKLYRYICSLYHYKEWASSNLGPSY